MLISSMIDLSLLGNFAVYFSIFTGAPVKFSVEIPCQEWKQTRMDKIINENPIVMLNALELLFFFRK